MNAAARALAHGIVIASAPTAIRRITISKSNMLFLSLILSIVISALSLITITDNNRIAFGDLATLSQASNDLETKYGQLLLEENTWSAPARVEAIAQQNFGMSQPDPQEVVIIKP
jgi:cell division protein FtsL